MALNKILRHMRTITKFCIFIALVVIIVTLSSGCTSSKGPTQASSNQVSSTPSMAAKYQGDFSSITHVDVWTKKGHWTSGAEDDGIIIYPDLKDVKGSSVTWSGINLPVAIEIYSTKFDSNFKESKDQLVYKGSGTISSWEDGNMFMGGGIQVPYSAMNVPSGKSYGWTYITVTLPDGKSFSGKFEYTSITP